MWSTWRTNLIRILENKTSKVYNKQVNNKLKKRLGKFCEIFSCLCSTSFLTQWQSWRQQPYYQCENWSLVLVVRNRLYSQSLVYICAKLRATWRTDTRDLSLFCVMRDQLRMGKLQVSLKNIRLINNLKAPGAKDYLLRHIIDHLKTHRKS